MFLAKFNKTLRDSEKISELQKKIIDIEENNIKLKTLIEINTYITNSLQKHEILKRILNQVKQLLECELSSILLVDEELNCLKFAVLSKDEEGKILGDTCLKMGEGIAGTVWENGSSILINDTQNDPRFSKKADLTSKTKTRSLMAVPLTVNGIIIGIIEAMNKIGSSFNSFDLQILQYISTQSAIAIKNADLYNMATKDGMTKLYIHKYFKERFQEEWNRSTRYKHNLSLIMLDIDNFKSFNDTYGHQAGDKILKEVADIIIKNSRSIDIPCRYGGEEFTIILPETSMEKAMLVGERIRASIENLKISYENSILQVTVSSGIASISEFTSSYSRDMIEMADSALYKSKRTGKNKITVYTSNSNTIKA